jgi:hypothetical protein
LFIDDYSFSVACIVVMLTANIFNNDHQNNLIKKDILKIINRFNKSLVVDMSTYKNH